MKFAVPILALAHLPADAAVIDGLWRSPSRESGAYLLVEVGPCRNAPEKHCGVVASAHNGAGREAVGAQVMRGMEPRADGTWRGTVTHPLSGDVYTSRVVPVSRDLMQVEGCLAGSLLCRTQNWTRER